jgi:hypothetical protein
MLPCPVLDNDQVAALAEMRELIDVAETCFVAKAEKRLVAPPRHMVDFAGPQPMFTIGGINDANGGGLAGFGVYETTPGIGAADSQLTAVWDTATHRLAGLIVGERWRTAYRCDRQPRTALHGANNGAHAGCHWHRTAGGDAGDGRAVIADPHRRVRPQRSEPNGLRRSPGTAVRGSRHLRDHQRAAWPAPGVHSGGSARSRAISTKFRAMSAFRRPGRPPVRRIRRGHFDLASSLTERRLDQRCAILLISCMVACRSGNPNGT